MRTLSLLLASSMVIAAADGRWSPVVSEPTGPAAGPPWISIEHPVNPYDQTTKGAFLVVHAFHHGTPVAFPVSGTAEGIVDGERRSLPLAFEKTSRTGAFALKKTWPSSGTWTLAIAVAQGSGDRAWAVVELGSDGEVAAVRVPTKRQDGWVIPAPFAMSEIDASLRARASRLAGR